MNLAAQMSRVVKIDGAEIGYDERDDFVVVRFTPEIGIELEHAERIIAGVLEAAAGRLHGNLVDARGLLFMSGEARARFARQSPVALSGTAIVVESKVQRMLANLYLSVARPGNTTRLFDDEVSARKWLAERNHEARRRRSSAPPASRG
jgi:hypothetical protein